jgi:cysteinyl-tRNA synthetase
LLRELSGVFGLRLERPEKGNALAAPFVDLLVETRRELRRQKLWALSDLIRERLGELGVRLEDGKEGTLWQWK